MFWLAWQLLGVLIVLAAIVAAWFILAAFVRWLVKGLSWWSVWKFLFYLCLVGAAWEFVSWLLKR